MQSELHNNIMKYLLRCFWWMNSKRVCMNYVCTYAMYFHNIIIHPQCRLDLTTEHSLLLGSPDGVYCSVLRFVSRISWINNFSREIIIISSVRHFELFCNSTRRFVKISSWLESIIGSVAWKQCGWMPCKIERGKF